MHHRILLLPIVLWLGFAPAAAWAGFLGDLFAPRVESWAVWEAFDPDSKAQVNHQPWTNLLVRYVMPNPDGVTRFAYGKVTAVDRAALEGYLATLQETPVRTLNRQERLAYWANFYNALTVKVVLDHYPVASILDIDISPGFFAEGTWDAKLVTVERNGLSLNDIEHRILRPIWKDPRVHYAINCASIGCPNLQTFAFASDGIDATLEDVAGAYINHSRGARVENNRLILSSIYSWFAEDFGGEAGVLAHLRAYAGPKLKEALAKVRSVDDYEYDWSLNDAAS
ncbi:MAG: DUF547 domain-containing protein [Alphaproteobacteria bacterium]|nr:DUF547 domain-containing protein [Alphaproteobacteria bacterium]